jgi:hypothetical protein
LKTYEWIREHKGESLLFKDFRMKIESDKGMNDNNNRNIYPLLKNGGLVNYESGGLLYVDNFYTKTGLAYVKTLEAMSLLESEGYSKEQIRQAEKKFEDILSEIIFGALKKIVKQLEVHYVEHFQDLIRFILKYGKISKIEYAYLLYIKQKHDIDESLKIIQEQVYLYRKGDLDFEISVKVRNDIDLRERTKTDNRAEALSFLTSYGYFTGLLKQAGLVKKHDKYFSIIEEKRTMLEILGGVINE